MIVSVVSGATLRRNSGGTSVRHPKTKPIKILINSPGGVADDGFAIYDLLKFVKAPVTTIVTGLAASAATIVMVGAQYLFDGAKVNVTRTIDLEAWVRRAQ